MHYRLVYYTLIAMLCTILKILSSPIRFSSFKDMRGLKWSTRIITQRPIKLSPCLQERCLHKTNAPMMKAEIALTELTPRKLDHSRCCTATLRSSHNLLFKRDGFSWDSDGASPSRVMFSVGLLPYLRMGGRELFPEKVMSSSMNAAFLLIQPRVEVLLVVGFCMFVWVEYSSKVWIIPHLTM